MSYLNFTPLGPGLDPRGISQVTNDNFYRLGNLLNQFDNGGWISGALPAVSSVSYNGNRSYDLTFNDDVSAILSPGMRIKTTRTVKAPTQCTSLNGSTQYWSDSTVSGFTATDDVSFMAWIYLTSYSASSQDIVGRGAIVSSGCGINLAASSGVLQVFGFAAGPTYRIYTAYQSIPLNKWVHVAGTLNMSAGSYKLYMDGEEIPGSLGSSGTPSAFVNTGDLWVGRRQSGTTYFNGKIAQAAIFSSVLTQATIKQYMTQGLTGTESTLVSAYSFDGTGNDLNTTNANNLSASGSAVATNADSPFSVNGSGTPTGTDDYALVQKVATAVATVSVPAGCTIPTSGGVAATYTSTQKNPLNWVADNYKWEISYNLRAETAQSSPAANTWYNMTTTSGVSGGTYLTVPVGLWDIRFQAVSYADCSSAATTSYAVHRITLSTASNTESDRYWTTRCSANNTTQSIGAHSNQGKLNLSVATPYYLNSMTDTTTTASIKLLGAQSGNGIFALPSGL